MHWIKIRIHERNDDFWMNWANFTAFNERTCWCCGWLGGWMAGWLVRLLDVACVSWVAYKAVFVGSKQTGISGLHNSQKVCQVWLCICCSCFVVANLDMQNKGTLQCQVKFKHSWTLCSVLGQQFIGKFQAPSTLSRLFHYCDRWWVMAMPQYIIIIVPVTRYDTTTLELYSSLLQWNLWPIQLTVQHQWTSE